MILIKKKNIIYVDSDDKKKVIKDTELPQYLWTDISIDRGVKFERIFNIIITNADIFSIIYAQASGFFPIDDFIKEFKKNPTELPTTSPNMGMYSLQVCWDVDMYEDEIYVFSNFGGLGLANDGMEEGKFFDCRYSIEFTPLNNLKQYKIEFVDDIVFTKFNMKTKKMDTLFSGKCPMKVFNFFGAIFFEITFSGLPPERSKKFEDIKKENTEIENFHRQSDDVDDVYFSIDKLMEDLKTQKKKK